MTARPAPAWRRTRAILVLAWGLALSATWGACGYDTGLRSSEQGGSVGLEIFGNDSPERDLERPLHDEISRSLRSLLDAPIVSPSKADLVVRGRILSYHRRSGIRTPENVMLETGITIEVEAALYARGSDVPRRGPFKASVPVGYLLGGVPDVIGTKENELEARDRALRHIAEELVVELFAPPE